MVATLRLGSRFSCPASRGDARLEEASKAKGIKGAEIFMVLLWLGRGRRTLQLVKLFKITD